MRFVWLLLAALSACTPVSTSTDPVEGAACTTEAEGFCSSTTRLLGCYGQVWAVASDCKGPDGCRRTGDDVYECDSSGNSVGDRCPRQSEGKVRCDPDGGVTILRCRDGGFDVEFVCPGSTRCSFVPDAGLSCR
ncbi:MAG: hypothetical protein JNG84_00985 [Archangium sp.]|nr:hypothetical protein [Archangium sp.]